jgi:outer membrane protein
VREATSEYDQAVLTLEEMERRVTYMVRQTYGDLAAALREAQSLGEASEAAQKSYDALRKEYRMGLVTNLDVLQALDLLQSQKSARDTARMKVKRLYLQFQVALEKIT